MKIKHYLSLGAYYVCTLLVMFLGLICIVGSGIFEFFEDLLNEEIVPIFDSWGEKLQNDTTAEKE